MRDSKKGKEDKMESTIEEVFIDYWDKNGRDILDSVRQFPLSYAKWEAVQSFISEQDFEKNLTYTKYKVLLKKLHDTIK